MPGSHAANSCPRRQCQSERGSGGPRHRTASCEGKPVMAMLLLIKRSGAVAKATRARPSGNAWPRTTTAPWSSTPTGSAVSASWWWANPGRIPSNHPALGHPSHFDPHARSPGCLRMIPRAAPMRDGPCVLGPLQGSGETLDGRRGQLDHGAWNGPRTPAPPSSLADGLIDRMTRFGGKAGLRYHEFHRSNHHCGRFRGSRSRVVRGVVYRHE
jgi:hypothetical protein